MNILFFGSSYYSLSVLQTLYRTNPYKIVGIISQPARRVGRKKTLSPTPVSEFAKKHNIPLFTPEKLDEESCQAACPVGEAVFGVKLPAPSAKPFSGSSCQADLIIVADYGLKLPKKLIELPKYGTLNLHPSLLPAYRGSSPAQWAILQGEKEAGITILTISEEFDQGKIIAQKKISILPTDTQETLYERCFEEGTKMLIQILPYWIKYCNKTTYHLPARQSPDGSRRLAGGPPTTYHLFLPPKPQPKNSPTPYARKLTKDDGQIDWSKPDTEIERMIRAFDPWPGTYTTLSELCKIKSQKSRQRRGSPKAAKVKSEDKRVKILKAHLDENGKLQIDKLQIEGKRPITWGEFERGYLNKS